MDTFIQARAIRQDVTQLLRLHNPRCAPKRELETLMLNIREKFEIMEQNAPRKLKLISALIQVKGKLRTKLENAARALEEMSDST